MSKTQNEARFLLTITANYSDGTEVNDIEIDASVPESDIGEVAMAAGSINAPEGVAVTSLVIVAVVAA
jgi:hypothetical protein